MISYIIYVTIKLEGKMQTSNYSGKIMIGDLIRRKIKRRIDVELAKSTGEFGIVVQRKMAGNPSHPCVDVLYPQSGKVYAIAESRVEMVSKTVFVKQEIK